MIRFTPATNHIVPGALLWTDAEALDVADDDPRVNDGRLAVRVLSVVNVRVLVSSMPGMPLTRAPLASVPPSKLWIQTGLADDPTRPNAIQEHPDKAPTQMVFPAGIDMSKVGTPGTPAVLARPAIVHADSQTWQLECPTCPLSVDGPPMVCAWGVRTPGGGFMVKANCPHNHGLARNDMTQKITTGCAYSGLGDSNG